MHNSLRTSIQIHTTHQTNDYQTNRTQTGLELCGGKISDKGLEQVARLPCLRVLNVSQNPRITQQGLHHLARQRHGTLEVLNLSHTQVDARAALGTLKQLRSLKVLAVNGCRGVDEEVVRELHSSLPYLRTVKSL